MHWGAGGTSDNSSYFDRGLHDLEECSSEYDNEADASADFNAQFLNTADSTIPFLDASRRSMGDPSILAEISQQPHDSIASCFDGHGLPSIPEHCKAKGIHPGGM